MTQPTGLVDRDKHDYVCRFNKALYRLKQAPRAWYIELYNFFNHSGFVNSLIDSSLFILNKQGNHIFVLVYVHDIIVTGSNQAVVERFIKLLSERFSLKDLDTLTYFLGIEASRTTQGLLLTQTKYITDLLARTNMFPANPVSTPMATNKTLKLTTGTELDDG